VRVAREMRTEGWTGAGRERDGDVSAAAHVR
jgi:hypothetical protein